MTFARLYCSSINVKRILWHYLVLTFLHFPFSSLHAKTRHLSSIWWKFHQKWKKTLSMWPGFAAINASNVYFPFATAVSCFSLTFLPFLQYWYLYAWLMLIMDTSSCFSRLIAFSSQPLNEEKAIIYQRFCAFKFLQ